MICMHAARERLGTVALWEVGIFRADRSLSKQSAMLGSSPILGGWWDLHHSLRCDSSSSWSSLFGKHNYVCLGALDCTSRARQ